MSYVSILEFYMCLWNKTLIRYNEMRYIIDGCRKELQTNDFPNAFLSRKIRRSSLELTRKHFGVSLRNVHPKSFQSTYSLARPLSLPLSRSKLVKISIWNEARHSDKCDFHCNVRHIHFRFYQPKCFVSFNGNLLHCMLLTNAFAYFQSRLNCVRLSYFLGEPNRISSG